MRLFINIDHVATVREARKADEPDPVQAACLAELGGADGITVHLREDRRHINDRDAERLRSTIRTPLNLEIANTPQMRRIAIGLTPHQVTVVPEKREEVTTEGGLDVADSPDLEAALVVLAEAGIRTSLFIDPEPDAVRRSADLGAHAVELHTGEYANSRGAERTSQLQRLETAARLGRDLGLAVHAGHGLTYVNVIPVAAIAHCEELNIGHSVVSRALFVGMERAVREMKTLVRDASSTQRSLEP
ncbi:MAG: pyridoxine 5'-phosphate synthase [Gemmatimonadota bacterium]|nr:pyridoxine 5'-phosphate synthase [Gemmatimonadota bacterium]